MPLLIIVAIAALLAVAAVIGIYNALVALRQRVRSGWSQIQVML
ncbi:MAG: LemA family protein, partial [Candidatus Eisenbacteria bacterium]|nr:LemA family protein [Candidatus Eisenbacteria bacterium]